MCFWLILLVFQWNRINRMLYYFGIITRKSCWELLKNELSGMDTKKPIKWGRMPKREGVKKKGDGKFLKEKIIKKTNLHS